MMITTVKYDESTPSAYNLVFVDVPPRKPMEISAIVITGSVDVVSFFETRELLESLHRKIDTLSAKIDQLLDYLTEENVEDVTDEEAKNMILEYLHDKKHCYPSDIAIDLDLDYEQVRRILEQLEDEGVVGPRDRQ